MGNYQRQHRGGHDDDAAGAAGDEAAAPGSDRQHKLGQRAATAAVPDHLRCVEGENWEFSDSGLVGHIEIQNKPVTFVFVIWLESR